MRCTETGKRWLGCLGVSVLGACSSPPPAPPPAAPPATPAMTGAPSAGPAAAKPAPGAPTPAKPAAPVRLGAPGPVRNWDEVRLQAARRLVAANPTGTYSGPVPDILLAIPVLEVELNGDGGIRRIDVLRQPRQARDTVQLAIDALHRAAPFGDVSRLPKPWHFTETFLFDDNRKFKPRTLDH